MTRIAAVRHAAPAPTPSVLPNPPPYLANAGYRPSNRKML
jgi:hypothetical protein